VREVLSGTPVHGAQCLIEFRLTVVVDVVLPTPPPA